MEFLSRDDDEKPEVRRPRFLADVAQQTRRPGFLGGSPDKGPTLGTPDDSMPRPPAPATAPQPARVDQYVTPPNIETTAPDAGKANDPQTEGAEPARPPTNPVLRTPSPAKEPIVHAPEPTAAAVAASDDRLRDAVNVLRRTAETLAEQARADALEIGLEVARHIIGQELKTNIKPILRRAIAVRG